MTVVDCCWVLLTVVYLVAEAASTLQALGDDVFPMLDGMGGPLDGLSVARSALLGTFSMGHIPR